MATILLVDDNPLRASLRQSILERDHATVVRVTDAAEALCLLGAIDFADRLGLIVASHPIHGISGPEFVTELQSRIVGIPVLILSSHPEAPQEYSTLPGVFVSIATSPEDFRATVKGLLKGTHRQSA